MARSAEHGGAAQPAWLSSGAAQLAFSALPDNAPELAVGFYNVGIQLGEVGKTKWDRKEQRLKQDIVDAFAVHDLDVLCLSELGEQGQGLGSKLPNNDRAIPPAVDAWLLELLSDSAAPPVSVYSDGHYESKVNTAMCLPLIHPLLFNQPMGPNKKMDIATAEQEGKEVGEEVV